MKHFVKIHILLSTYNGEKYLIPQLDSIFSQTYHNFNLFIRDDGSSDNTLDILHTYIQKHPEYADQIVLLPNPASSNIGYMNSFWTLLKECSGADYYSFCDQDDVWMPDKLQKAIEFLNKEEDSLPLLYFSNYYYCNENLVPQHKAPDVSLPITLENVLFYTPAFGFSIVINERLRQMMLLTATHNHLPHDGWCQKLAAAFGKIIYNEQCTAYYRRHSNAVTFSYASYKSAIQNWIKNDLLGSAMKENHYILTRFYQEYGHLLKKEDAALLKLFAVNKSSLGIWWKRLTYKHRLRPSFGGNLALKICFFLNTY